MGEIILVIQILTSLMVPDQPQRVENNESSIRSNVSEKATSSVSSNIGGSVKRIFEQFEKGQMNQTAFRDSIQKHYGSPALSPEVQRKLNDPGITYTNLMKVIQTSNVQSPRKDLPASTIRPNTVNFHRYKRSPEGASKIEKVQTERIQPFQFGKDASKVDEIRLRDSRELNNFFSRGKDAVLDVENLVLDNELRHISKVYVEKKKRAPEDVNVLTGNGDIITWSPKSTVKPSYLVSSKVTRKKAVDEIAGKYQGNLDNRLLSATSSASQAAKKEKNLKYHTPTTNVLKWD
eukprot:TRINITY_DN4542_c0_g1_i1.p1 TRINITY_DN4542_c0_g1~~TRINITY_DN4542_c0_g1_i1.p1  ORF type:complete len:291 (-),score=69.85 TRINITY_DN4542_c0_g1_i1:111-983(-)